MENLNEVLKRIETLLKELRDFFKESHRWGDDNNFINTINEIYNLIKYEKLSLTRQKEEIVFLEEQILTRLSKALESFRENLKNLFDSSVIEFKSAIELNAKELRNATEPLKDYFQRKKSLISVKKELTELKSKVYYFKKMQVGKDYFFSIQISYNENNFIKLEFRDLISKTLTIKEMSIKAKEGFIIRLISPTMTISPPFRKVVIDSKNKVEFKKHIYFKVSPNYSGNFIIIMEYILEDKILYSSDEEFEVSVQDKGLEWDCKDKTHKRQLSASAVKFFSINSSILAFLGYDFVVQDSFIGSFFIGYLIFFAFALICSYSYARKKGYGWYRKSEIIESDPNKIYKKKKGQD